MRRLFDAAGRSAVTWEVSSGSTPAGLDQELRSLGMETHDDPASMLALACTSEPVSSSPGVTVERVETEEQFQLVRDLYHQDNGRSPSDEWLRGPGVTRYLARIEGRPVATADLTLLKDQPAVFLGGA